MGQDFYNEVKKQIEPVFSDFYKTSPSYEAFLNSQKQLVERMARINNLQNEFLGWQTFLNDNSCPKKHIELMNAFLYLTWIELTATYFVNLTLLLMVGKGHFLHLEPDFNHKYVRHATSLSDIESPSLPLSIKLDFLEANGMKFFGKWVNRKLRNKIAHGDFLVNENGDFFLVDSKGKKSLIDFGTIFQQFTNYYNAVSTVFMEFLSAIG